MPKDRKDDAWKIINCHVIIEECGRKWVEATMGTCWRNHKARLKRKYYLKYKTDAERINARPLTVPINHWKILIAYWNSNETKAISETNKVHQSKRKCMHTTGSKSFAQVREEERRKNDGQEVDRVQMFRLTHTKRNGKLMEQVVRVVEELEEEKQKSATDPSSSELMKGPDDVFAKVLTVQVWSSRLSAQQEEILKSTEQEIAQKLRQEFEKEMKMKLEEQDQKVRATMAQGFCFVLSQIQQQIPGLDFPIIDELFMSDAASAHHEPSSSTHQVPKDFDGDFEDEDVCDEDFDGEY